jgi:hypothetical protein
MKRGADVINGEASKDNLEVKLKKKRLAIIIYSRT